MALIICPECGGKVSDQAPACIHCGYPLDQLGTREQPAVPEKTESGPYALVLDNVGPTKIKCAAKIASITGMKAKDVTPLTDAINFNYIAHTLVTSRASQQNIPKCPTCGSMNISKISNLNRAASVAMFGGMSRKINKSFKCENCGYTW